jgi:MoxR-like ATPase
VLADEINRATPKTQAALLEAMEERQVTVDRETFTLADDFLVIATQNPRDFEGTYPLPESQLDRFMLAVRISHAPREEELRILETYNLPGTGRLEPTALSALAPGAVASAREAIANVHLSEDLLGYILDLAAATRDSSQLDLGLSSRGAVALTRCARIEACLNGREYVLPDDVKSVAPWVVGHRLVLSSEAILEGTTTMDVLNHVLDNVQVPH